MLTRTTGVPLICIKTFRYSAREVVMLMPSSASAHSLPIFQKELVMSDANLSADKIRAMLAEANARLRKASAEYFDLLEKGLSSSPLPVADQAKQFCGYMQRNVTATFDLGDKLIQAKDMQDAVRIQSEFFQDQMRSLTDHAKSMGESAMKAATGVFTPKS
jgi:phasin